MKRIGRICVVLAVLMVGNAAAFDDQEVIDYRRHIMAALKEQVALIELMAQNKVPAADFAINAQALAVTAAQAKQAFKAQVEGGQSKPAVWQNWDDFSKRLDAMSAATADLAKTAKSGGLSAASSKIPAAVECKSCHEVYLNKK